MNEELTKLIKQTWLDYFTGGQKECIKRAGNLAEDYEQAMQRLETDFDLQAELGIGI